MDHDDFLRNIKGIWQDIDDLTSKSRSDRPLIPDEEIRILMDKFYSFSEEEQYDRIVALTFINCLLDRRMLKALYTILEMDYDEDAWVSE